MKNGMPSNMKADPDEEGSDGGFLSGLFGRKDRRNGAS